MNPLPALKRTGNSGRSLKHYLQPEVLEENTNKPVNSRFLLLEEVLSFIFGIILLISSIGIFIHASWLWKLVYVTMPMSIMLLLELIVGIYLRPLVLPQSGFWLSFLIEFGILAVLLVGYNFFLYTNFTRPKAREQFKQFNLKCFKLDNVYRYDILIMGVKI